MSREHHIAKGTRLAVLHRLSAKRCVIIQNVVGIPAGLFAFACGCGIMQQSTSSLGTSVFVGLFNILTIFYMHRYGWYNLCERQQEHLNAAQLYDSLVDALVGTARNGKGNEESLLKKRRPVPLHMRKTMHVAATFEKALATTPSIPAAVLWLTADY